jgi:hypothetical protein
MRLLPHRRVEMSALWFTFADINLLPILYRLRQVPEGAEALAAATRLTAITTSMQLGRASRAPSLPPAHRAGTRRVRRLPISVYGFGGKQTWPVSACA